MRVGTRASQLARVQTAAVVDALTGRDPSLSLEVVPITTGGDKVQNKPIAEIGTRGVFVKELEEALLSGDVDLVVHSLKDLPTETPEGLALISVPMREDPRDVLVSKDGRELEKMPQGSRLATSSRRRAAQIRAARPDLDFVDVRGNITTRLAKLDSGHCDCMILAAAGLLRLELPDRIAQLLDPDFCTPAAGQGALAVQCRSTDRATISIVKALDDPIARAEVDCERAYLAELGGGCSVPIGALARASGGRLTLTGCIASLDGSQIFRASREGDLTAPGDLGRALAEQMVESGAQEVVASLRASLPNIVSPP